MIDLDKLAEYRTESGLSLDEISDRTGISSSSISRVYSGATANPGIDTLSAILRVTGGSLDEICGIAKPTLPDGITQVDLEVLRIFAKSQNKTQSALQAHIIGLQKQLNVSMIANILFVALIIFVLFFDLSHPNMGWVQYTVQAVTTAADSLKTMFQL